MHAGAGSTRIDRTHLLALGFGTTVAMWAVGYVSRIPPAIVPSSILLVLLLLCWLAGGLLTGRLTGRGARGGAEVGLVSGILNLLILGSFLGGEHPNSVVPTALLWIPGSLLAGAVLGALGAAIGARGRRAAATVDWTAAFTRVTVAATFLLVIVGGLVTSHKAGLAVVDWPNSFGYNMFLYPLSRMTGGIYYEHAHRLFGSLVGLTTLVMAIHLQKVEGRAWLRRLAWIALAVVIVQGLLGGLRVTGRFTMSQSPDDTAPSIILAIVHGVLAQIFLGMVTAIAAFTSMRWKEADPPAPHPAASTDAGIASFLVGVLFVQLVLGAIQRHLAHGLLIHITMAAFVLLVSLTAGIRAAAIYKEIPLMRRLGRSLTHIVTVQVLLGIGAMAGKAAAARAIDPPAWAVLVTTAHQAAGATLLAASALLAVWSRRLLKSPEAAQ